MYSKSVFSPCPGAPGNKRLIVFVDDLNMPKLDSYGSQPPIELLRQFQDFSGFYDRELFFWKEIQVMHYTTRTVSHLNPLSVLHIPRNGNIQELYDINKRNVQGMMFSYPHTYTLYIRHSYLQP